MLQRRMHSVFWLCCVGCLPELDTTPRISVEDIDGDGWTIADGDCWEDSTQPWVQEGALSHEVVSSDVYPGAPEQWYDGVDQNCDGLDDFDRDQDGFVPNEYVGIPTLTIDGTGNLQGGDCNDREEGMHPDAVEWVADNIDSNCDQMELCFVDRDYDGAGIEETTSGPLDCQADGVADNSEDCDDENPYVYPSSSEVCDGIDNNCDGSILDAEVDLDGDGYVTCIIDGHGWLGDLPIDGGNDCDDSDALKFPGQRWYLDADADGYGTDHWQDSCGPTGLFTSLFNSDCNPSNATIHPMAVETLDSIDSNCDGLEVEGYQCAGIPAGVAGYFLMCHNHQTASAATVTCHDHGYDGLASILSASENQMLQSLNVFADNGVWLGASDSTVENQFEWSDGSSWNYENWMGSHPFSNGSAQNCVKMLSNGQWSESSCTSLLTGFACSIR